MLRAEQDNRWLEQSSERFCYCEATQRNSTVKYILVLPALTFNNSTFCPHSVFVWISEQTAIISLYNINGLVFITETECVYCAVRSSSSNKIQVTFSLGLSSTLCFA